MDIFNTVKSVLGGGGNQKPDLISLVMNLIGNQGGGLNGLISQFASKGLGDIASSWVSTGKNIPISPGQVNNALGKNTISEMASKLGIGEHDIASQLSDLLPQLVDKLTPDGEVPDGDIMERGADILGGLLGRK